MAGMRVRLGRRHPMTGVRVRLGRLLGMARVWIGLSLRHDMAGVRVRLGRLLGMARVPGMTILSEGRRGDAQQQTGEDQDNPSHAPSPSSGRTVTTLNMPACMCIRR
jgi:hypothetical protein